MAFMKSTAMVTLLNFGKIGEYVIATNEVKNI